MPLVDLTRVARCLNFGPNLHPHTCTFVYVSSEEYGVCAYAQTCLSLRCSKIRYSTSFMCWLIYFFLQALYLDSITTHHWLIQGCSAVTGENLFVGNDWTIDDIASRIFTMTKNLHVDEDF